MNHLRLSDAERITPDLLAFWLQLNAELERRDMPESKFVDVERVFGRAPRATIPEAADYIMGMRGEM